MWRHMFPRARRRGEDLPVVVVRVARRAGFRIRRAEELRKVVVTEGPQVPAPTISSILRTHSAMTRLVRVQIRPCPF